MTKNSFKSRRAAELLRTFRILVKRSESKTRDVSAYETAMVAFAEAELLESVDICVANQSEKVVLVGERRMNDATYDVTDEVKMDSKLASKISKSYFADPHLWTDSPQERLKSVLNSNLGSDFVTLTPDALEDLVLLTSKPQAQASSNDADLVLRQAIALWIVLGDLNRCENFFLHAMRVSATSDKTEFVTKLRGNQVSFFEEFVPLARKHREENSPDVVREAAARRKCVWNETGTRDFAAMQEIDSWEKTQLQQIFPTEWHLNQEIVKKCKRPNFPTSFAALVRMGKQSLPAMHSAIDRQNNVRGDVLAEHTFLRRLEEEEPILFRDYREWRAESEKIGRLSQWNDILDLLGRDQRNPNGI